jgi:hypothetical protein
MFWNKWLVTKEPNSSSESNNRQPQTSMGRDSALTCPQQPSPARRSDLVFRQMNQISQPSYSIWLRSVLTLYVSTSSSKMFLSFIVPSNILTTLVFALFYTFRISCQFYCRKFINLIPFIKEQRLQKYSLISCYFLQLSLQSYYFPEQTYHTLSSFFCIVGTTVQPYVRQQVPQ